MSETNNTLETTEDVETEQQKFAEALEHSVQLLVDNFSVPAWQEQLLKHGMDVSQLSDDDRTRVWATSLNLYEAEQAGTYKMAEDEGSKVLDLLLQKSASLANGSPEPTADQMYKNAQDLVRENQAFSNAALTIATALAE